MPTHGSTPLWRFGASLVSMILNAVDKPMLSKPANRRSRQRSDEMALASSQGYLEFRASAGGVSLHRQLSSSCVRPTPTQQTDLPQEL